MKSNDDIVHLAKKQQNISKRGLSVQYDNTIACQAFYNGEPQNMQDYIQFGDVRGRRRRALVNFNNIQSNVDSVLGFMQQNRRQAKYIARVRATEAQQLYSRNMNAIYEYHRENENADHVESEIDADMLINGYGATETELSYIVGNATRDPNGEIIKTRLDPMKVYWDPHAKDKNLNAARWAGYYEDFELKDALNLFQNSKKDDFAPIDDDVHGDAGYQFNPWGGVYDKIKVLDSVEWTSKEEELVRVYVHQWFEYETFYKAQNPLFFINDPMDVAFAQMKLESIEAQIKSYGPDDIEVKDMFSFDTRGREIFFDEMVKKLLVEAFGDVIKPIPFKRKCFYTAVMSGRHIFSAFKSISQQGFSIKFKTGSYNETNKIWVGMVNSMMEPQKYYNKALTELMFTIAANSKGGVIIERNAVEDINEFEQNYARTDSVIVVEDGAVSGNKIQPKASPAIPTGLQDIITLSDAAISKAGVDPAFMGAPDVDQSGILYKRRIRQVISKMAKYFDSISLYQKEDARLHADLIPVWVQNNNGQFIRITGQDGADEFLQITEDALAAEYDVTIQEAAQTPEDQQELAQVLSTFGDRLIAVNPVAGQTFYAESLNMLPIDGDSRNRLMKVLLPDQEMIPAAQAQAQIQSLQQMIEQLNNKLTQVEVEKKLSEIRKNEADIKKTQAETARTMEDAANKGLENDLIRGGKYSQVNVSI